MSEFTPDAELEMVLEADGSSGSVANNLTTTEEGYVLDARQGPAIVLLLNGKVDLDKIVNNLTTTAAGYVLDARQGKELKDAVDAKLPLSGGTLKGSLQLNNGKLYLLNDSFGGVASMSFAPGTFALQLSEGNNISNRFALTSDGFFTYRPFAISNGGTGATDAPTARKNLGAVNMVMYQRVLEASKWITNDAGVVMYSLYIDDLLETDGVIVSPHGNSRWYYNDMDMFAHENHNGYMTFISNNGIPVNNVTVCIMRLREG